MLEVEPVGLERLMGGDDEVVEGRRGQAFAEWLHREIAGSTRPQGRDRGLQVVGIRVDVRGQVGELDARSQLVGGVDQTVGQRLDDRVDVREDVGDDVAMLRTHGTRV